MPPKINAIERALVAQKTAFELISQARGDATQGVDPYDDLDSALQRAQRAVTRLERAVLILGIQAKSAEITQDTSERDALQALLNTKPVN